MHEEKKAGDEGLKHENQINPMILSMGGDHKRRWSQQRDRWVRRLDALAGETQSSEVDETSMMAYQISEP
jgi:hypothetical protein